MSSMKLNRGKGSTWASTESEGGLTFPEVLTQSTAPQRAQNVSTGQPKISWGKGRRYSHLLPLRVTQAWVTVVATVTSSKSSSI